MGMHTRKGSPPGDLDSLAQAARDTIAHWSGENSLEALWHCAGARTLLGSQIIDPPAEELKSLSLPTHAWDTPSWPAELIRERGECIANCHLLAIAYSDRAWLEQLDHTWERAPVDEEWKDISRGQIGLALRPGTLPDRWTDDDLEWFARDGYLNRARPKDRAWIALSFRDLGTAAAALEEYRAQMDASVRARTSATPGEIRRILASPGETLQVELRALAALVRHNPNQPM